MPVEIKFCGLTRAIDASRAAALGATHLGVVFAGGPRTLTPDRARDVLRDAPKNVRRVGVFGDQTDEEIARIAEIAQLDVVQLHAPWDLERVIGLRDKVYCEIWPVLRVEGAALPRWTLDALMAGDSLLLDAFVPGALGGTGVALPWVELATELKSLRSNRRIVLAGGLRPENVAIAIAALAPHVVDVSSGVESAPGIKDHDRMRAFRDAVTQASTQK